MKTVEEVNDYLANIISNNREGSEEVRLLVNEYMDGILTFGEMLDGIRDAEVISVGLKFDGIMALGFSLNEATKMLLS